jgi:NADPH-dependent 2,4-dienoyl-CoA reductase/sulfur reductase-like enzyme
MDTYIRIVTFLSRVAGVFAAGDVAETRNLITGAAEVHAIEPTAQAAQ